MADHLCVVCRSGRETAGDPALQGRGASGARAFEDAVAEAIRQAGHDVLVMPHLYYLDDAHPGAGRLREADGPLVVASWLYPRAAFWTLAFLGVPGECAGRKIACVDLGAHESPRACARQVLSALEGVATSDAARIDEITDPVSTRWHPVLDYSRCVGCRQCLGFCLFGAYSLEGERVVVSGPERCKPGCPACARVCPKGAVMFPHYAADAAIAGAPGEIGAAQAADPAASPTDDLDELIDALDELED